MNKLLLVMAVFLLVGVANAAISWEPTVVDPNTGAADWSLTTSWRGGVVPVAGDVVLFREYSGVECRVTGDETANNVRVGRRGHYPGPLRIMPGGTLTCSANNSFVGDDYVGHMVVERGGSFYSVTAPGINIGDEVNATGSSLTINGGVVTSDGFVSLASEGGGGIIDLNGGLIEADSAEGDELMWGENNTVDISFGKIVVHEDITTDVAEEIAAGRLTAFDGAGTVAYSYDGDATTITSIDDPLERYPTYDDVVQPGFVDLSWVNLEPNAPGGQVWVDVWFGSDPNTPFPDTWDKVVDAETTDTVQVSAPVGEGGLKEYIWQVVTYRYGDPANGQYNYGDDPNLNGYPVDEGMMMYFAASDDEPPSVVMDTPPTATWINEPIPLQATVYDDGKSAVTVTWTSDEDPNAVFDPPTTVIPAQASYQLTGIAVTTSVTVDYQSGTFTVTATVSDLNPLDKTDSGTVEHHCSGTPCGATRNQVGLAADHPDDIDGDCMHDLADYGAIAEYYGTPGYALTEPQVIP